MTVRPGESAFVRLDLEPCGRVRGRVVDEAGNRTPAMVYLGWGGNLRGSFAPHGEVDIRAPRRAEPYRLYAEHVGRRSPEVLLSLLAPGEVRDFGALALPPK